MEKVDACTSIEYRLLRADEVGAAADLWVDEHEDPDPNGTQHQAWRRQFRALPHLLSHTWVAVAPDGALLSIGRYWPLWVHSAGGVPQKVGRISHVFTHASARRQGHAARLLELMIAAMRAEGCLWSILSTSDEGQPLYTRYGWQPLPLRQVTCGAASRPRQPSNRYTIRPYDPEEEPDGWAAIQHMHQAYNAGRPLTTIRDQSYWEYQIENIRWWRSTGRAEVLVATEGEENAPRAYALAFFSQERGLLLAELGAPPGEEEALLALLSSILARPIVRTLGGRLCLPRDPALECLLPESSDHVEDQVGGDCMVRAIAPDFDARQLDALPVAAGNVLWLLDDF
jgi:GNAT superfamily N-acetyltransferase